MNTDFVQTLMANNDRAREHALRLNAEVGRLRQREAELTKRVIDLLTLKGSVTPEEKAFLDWLITFRLEAEEAKSNEEKKKLAAPTEPEDPKSAVYVAKVDEPPAQTEKLVRVREELKLLSRLKRREKFQWIEARQLPSDAELFGWETHKHVTLPGSIRELYRNVGGNADWRHLDANQTYIHAYSPLLALLPLDQVGWTEIWSQDNEPEEGYRDDSEAKRVLEHFEVGHEFDDSFICEQLCGKHRDEDIPVKVLLVGAPLNVKVMRNGKAITVTSRMFLNIRPTKDATKFVGDGLLYRLDTTFARCEEGDSELVKVGTAHDWMESCFISEVEDRLKLGGEKDPLVQRYPWVLEQVRNKKAKMANEEAEASESEAAS